MVEVQTAPELTCKRCDYKWKPRVPVVRTCPRCKSSYWDTDRKIKKEKISV